MIQRTQKRLLDILLVKLPLLGRRRSIIYGFAAFFVIFWIDYVTSYEINISVLYLFPILIITQSCGLRSGIGMSLACSISIKFTNFISGQQYSHSLYFILDGLVTFFTFSTISVLADAVYSSYIQEQSLARLDSLTQISNRRSFFELAEIELMRCQRHSRVFNLIVVDVDNFKFINDSFGHLEGDKILQLIARTIANNIRRTDIVARLGGDEFAIILTDISKSNAIDVTNKIRLLLSKAMVSCPYSVTLSFGIASCEDKTSKIEEILLRADMAMYAAKQSGGDIVSQSEEC